jgi:NADH-quinone oxidoreductase subunit C
MTVEEIIRNACPDAVIESRDLFGVTNLKLQPSALHQVCVLLTENGFDYLADITTIDWNDRIEVVYQFTNLTSNEKIALRVDLDRQRPEVDSLIDIWKGADFQEREAFDLMGVVFKGHPDLRRILLPEDWEGYPLRKDYVIPD